MRRNTHTPEEQREMAIAAAELMLVQRGMDGLSMRKVAGAIGYAVGQLYKIFRNQDELLLAISERTATALLAELQAAIAGEKEPARQIRAVSHAYIAFGLRYPNRWRLLFSHRIETSTELPQGNIQKAQTLFGFLEELLTAYSPQLERGDLRETATALWAGVHGIAALAIDDKLSWSERDDPMQICDRMLRGFMAGLRPQHQQKSPRAL